MVNMTEFFQDLALFSDCFYAIACHVILSIVACNAPKAQRNLLWGASFFSTLFLLLTIPVLMIYQGLNRVDFFLAIATMINPIIVFLIFICQFFIGKFSKIITTASLIAEIFSFYFSIRYFVYLNL